MALKKKGYEEADITILMNSQSVNSAAVKLAALHHPDYENHRAFGTALSRARCQRSPTSP